MQTISVCHLGFDPTPNKGVCSCSAIQIVQRATTVFMLTPFSFLNTLSYLLSPHQILLLLWGVHQGAPLWGLSLWTPNFIVMTFFPETRTPVVHRHTWQSPLVWPSVWVSVAPSRFVPIFLVKYLIVFPFPLRNTPVWIINWDHSSTFQKSHLLCWQ